MARMKEELQQMVPCYLAFNEPASYMGLEASDQKGWRALRPALLIPLAQP